MSPTKSALCVRVDISGGGIPVATDFTEEETYLSVDEAHDGCLHPHADGEARVHVLVVEEGLHAGQQEHEEGEEVALPQG